MPVQPLCRKWQARFLEEQLSGGQRRADAKQTQRHVLRAQRDLRHHAGKIMSHNDDPSYKLESPITY